MRSTAFIALPLTLLLLPSLALAQQWEDRTAQTIGDTAQWSNKVELADLDGDGQLDILFANGGGYNTPGQPELNRVFINQGPGMPFAELSEQVFGPSGDLARVIKVRDLNGDGLPDIVVGTTYQTQSRLYLGQGGVSFSEVTDTNLPALELSIGDLEAGDVDGDGDLDLVLADWGDGNPFNVSAPARLWLNDGEGVFTDATEGAMPGTPVEWSWELELLDIDNDYDLDIAVSCKQCSGSKLYLNDGTGQFSDVSDRLPQFTNNYEFEPIDANGDGWLDLLTINDGPSLRENVFLNDGTGAFVDATAQLWPDEANVGVDDNVIAVLDYDSDGDPDFLIGALGGGGDRLIVNGGEQGFSLIDDAFEGTPSTGTLGIAVGDLDGDARIDVVQSQGELADDERVHLGVDVAPDTAPPVIDLLEQIEAPGGLVRARVHDNKTPVRDEDFASVELRAGDAVVPMRWYGGSLWRAELELSGASSYELCAVDVAGNESCESVELEPGGDDSETDTDGGSGETGDGDGDADSEGETDDSSSETRGGDPAMEEGDSGCGCSTRAPTGSGALFLLLLVGLRRPRTRD